MNFAACKVPFFVLFHVYITHIFNFLILCSVYADVIPALEKWKLAGKTIYIYSSGSVPAQKLLVGYTTKGDLMHVSKRKKESR